MKSYCFALAALAVMGLASAAYAGDAAPKAMSDSEMDKVTAAGQPPTPGIGNFTASQAGGAAFSQNGFFHSGKLVDHDGSLIVGQGRFTGCGSISGPCGGQ